MLSAHIDDDDDDDDTLYKCMSNKMKNQNYYSVNFTLYSLSVRATSYGNKAVKAVSYWNTEKSPGDLRRLSHSDSSERHPTKPGVTNWCEIIAIKKGIC